jgi:sulfoxide reductase heme-binding subunit YedZ
LCYLSRGFGLVALILLRVVMVLGLTQAVRLARPGWPRFAITRLHKNAALLVVVVFVVHIAAAVADSYAPIHIV